MSGMDQHLGDQGRSAITRDIYLCVIMNFTVCSSPIFRLIKSTVQEISEQLWPQGVPRVNCYYLYSEKLNENQDIRDPNIKQVRVFWILKTFVGSGTDPPDGVSIPMTKWPI